jgi:hypothetical protein
MSEKDTHNAFEFIGDEYWGQGGRYVVDPATGKRSPAPPIEEAAAPGSIDAQGLAPVAGN